MKILVVYAHPLETSFGQTLKTAVVEALEAAGHTVDLCDLYSEGFEAALSRQERLDYRDTGKNREHVSSHVARLQAADGLVVVFPSWWYGMSAILKGYFDRVWLPGVAFEFGPQAIRPTLGNLKVFGVVTTTGAPGWFTRLYMGNPNRKVLMRGLSRLIPGRVERFWLALYGVDRSTPAQRAVFIDKVRSRVSRVGQAQ